MNRISFYLAIAFILITSVATARAETIHIPVTVDYPMVREIFVKKLYNLPGEEAVVVDEFDGCTRIELWTPEIAPEKGKLRVGSTIRIRAGAYVLGECIAPVDWEGYIETLQQVTLDKSDWALHFKTVDSRLFDSDRRPATTTNVLWELIKKFVHPFLGSVTVDLAPPVGELRTFLPDMFAKEVAADIDKWIGTLRPGDITVADDALRTDILMDATLPAAPPKVAEKALTKEELAKFIDIWESWDAFLVYQIHLLAGGEGFTMDEKRTALDTLLDARYQFTYELLRDTPNRDIAREQFIKSWQALAPMFKKRMVNKTAGSKLNYIAFFTAVDALSALDKLGPAMGIEISRDGLLRMARLVAKEGTTPSLAYSYAMDTDLRKIFGLGAPLDDSGPAFTQEEIELGENPPAPMSGVMTKTFAWFYGVAWAATPAAISPADMAEVKKWLPSSDQYVEKVWRLVNETVEATLKKSKLDQKYHNVFRHLTPAAVWQESCWKQFVEKQGKVTYLKSYNNTSVGMMQINERVWRGLYKPESLRWNIRYNAQAGAEILESYTRENVIAKMKADKPLDDDTIARLVYAIYNGGPSEYAGLLRRQKSGKYFPSDDLFWEKYQQAGAGHWAGINDCASGGK